MLDWPTLWRVCRDCGAQWLVAEHDKPYDPNASRAIARPSSAGWRLKRMKPVIRPDRLRQHQRHLLHGAARSQLVRIKACADVRPEAARGQGRTARRAGDERRALLADPEIEIVINLTVPAVPCRRAQQILAAGKHVYLEKPLATRFADAKPLCGPPRPRACGWVARRTLSSAPRTRHAAPDRRRSIGRPIGGAVAVLSHGMESWHPNPAFFYQRGGGPIHDVGPYYITQLVNLLGPVARVSAGATIGNPRAHRHQRALAGQTIDVEVPTMVNGTLEFAQGANVTMSPSWDVWSHRRAPIEIYGTEGSLLAADPNFFGGEPTSAGATAHGKPGHLHPSLWREQPDDPRGPPWPTIALSASSTWPWPSAQPPASRQR